MKTEFIGKLMEAEISVLSEVTQSQRDQCHIFFHSYMDPSTGFLELWV